MTARISLFAALALALAACGRPEPARAPDLPPACNDVAINPAAPARTVAAAAAAVSLLGGPIEPGVYDLVSITPHDGAPAAHQDLWESVRVRDTPEGIVLDFAIVRGAPTNAVRRVNALLEEGPPARLVHVCGATGGVPVSYAARGAELQLLLPAEGGVGQVMYSFVRRAR